MGITAEVSVPLAFLAGLISFLSPCTLPIFPSFLAYLSGANPEELSGTEGSARMRIMLNAFLFVLGFSIVFILLGASVSALGKLLLSYQPLLVKLSGVLLISFGLLLTGWLRIPFMYREFHPIQIKSRPAGYTGALAVGIAFGVGWTPCIGPVLGAILTMAGTSQGVKEGILLLSVYSFGLAIPFLLGAWFFRSFLDFTQRFRGLARSLQIGGGLTLAGMGLLLLTGYFQVLNNYALALTPGWIVRWL